MEDLLWFRLIEKVNEKKLILPGRQGMQPKRNMMTFITIVK